MKFVKTRKILAVMIYFTERSKVMIALISGHYLSSKVCIEELSLAIALQCQGTAKIWPVVIEPLSENLPWLKLISPVQCFIQPSAENFPGIAGLCKNILKDVNGESKYFSFILWVSSSEPKLTCV